MNKRLAVLLLRIASVSDLPSKVYAEQLFTNAGKGTRNLVDYYDEMSHGRLDIGQSQVFDWIDFGHTNQDLTDEWDKAKTAKKKALKDAGSSESDAENEATGYANGVRRGKINEWARQAAAQNDIDLSKFDVFVCVFNQPVDYFGSYGEAVVNWDNSNDHTSFSVDLTGVSHEMGGMTTTPMIRADDLHKYLTRFGYLDADAVPGEATRAALRRYQRFNGLAETGELDDATAALMSTPRCGNPDVSSGAAAVLFGTRWPTLDLRYGFANFTDDLTRSEIRGAVRRAFARWSAVTRLTFTEAPIDDNPEIKIRFATGVHGDGSPFDGFSSTLAHAFYPPPNGGDLSGDIHFDEDEPWTLSILGTLIGPDLQSVATHEIGHALGLQHSSRGDAIMQPHLRPGRRRRDLRHDDLAGIQEIYGSPTGDWKTLGGGLTSGPAACSLGGRLHVFARGEDNAIWHTSSDRWGDWDSIGGGLTSGPAVCSWGRGRLDVFARGEDFAMWHTWYDGRWHDWESLGGGFTSGPAAVALGPGRIDVFARGEPEQIAGPPNMAIWHNTYRGGWIGWASLGGGLTSEPGACTPGPDRLDVFARGEDNAIWHTYSQGAYPAWRS